MRLENLRTNETIASDVTLAATRQSRRRGLLGRESLDASSALVLCPCWSIHTVGMRFAIDVVFVDRHGCVLRIVPGLSPWRIAVMPRAHSVIELPAGRARSCSLMVGDTLWLAPVPGSDALDPATAQGTTPEWLAPRPPR